MSTRSVKANPEGQKKLRSAQWQDGKSLTYERIEEITGISKTTIERFFRGIGIDRSNAEGITQCLRLNLSDIVDSPFSLEKVKTFTEMIEEQIQRLTTNPLTARGGMTFNSTDIYVPLDLKERKQQPIIDNVSIKDDVKYTETKDEITRVFNNNEFFEEVLEKGNSPKSNNQRIAIIGEPGAGKTTFLQKVAKWLLNNKQENTVIWVSLADLQEQSLEDYLLQEWLKQALKVKHTTEEAQNTLVEIFKQGQVWLLLDGVDEMGLNNPLLWINTQLKSWINSAKIILTCRLNVWDTGKNYLEKFDVYCNLNFNEQQVEHFIDKWLATVNPNKYAISLKEELNRTGNQKIRNLIKQPLCLTLLCYSWQLRGERLPETKAGLYKCFVEHLYEWKSQYFSTTSTQQEELNKALGELAKNSLDQSSSRFRLTHTQVVNVLGTIDEPSSLFKLALNIGWLNKVGVAAENPNEPVYTFFHPSFLEYFAAISIDNYNFFINHIPENPEQGIYRVSEPQWKEVILLWLGQDNNKIDEKHKNSFIQTVIKFIDNENNLKFYRLKALKNLKDWLEEFSDCFLNEIIFIDYDNLEQQYFYDFHVEKSRINHFDQSIYVDFCQWLNVEIDPNFPVSLLIHIDQELLNEILVLFLNKIGYFSSNVEDNVNLIINYFLEKESINKIRLGSILSLNKILHNTESIDESILIKIVQLFKKYPEYECNLLLEYCSKHMSYPNFSRAWHGEAIITNETTIQYLNQQYTDISEILNQLTPTQTIYPICINIKTISEETNIDKLAKGISNRIFKTIANYSNRQINDVYDLENQLINLKTHLNISKLALIFYGDNPSSTFLTLCKIFSDEASIAVITTQPVEPPLRGFIPNQPFLVNALQTWLNEME
ncbi:hypothetical protein C7H19_18705 [Aphanothece hegewaldii CCALA 016]|uniref:NACHT domain-containing protein n=1 Tax=Aphanothece hegewaldii CCALA 016 TaxID=2107694 RepID=A0A2T1LTN3_9CHRO|nr:NACHT domain-containing protein [Aphanothece hegewaldii]PSF34461.1 hypothetical protein C7H19_18705 [Aphanothece hegewaldii CCALA 016]